MQEKTDTNPSEIPTQENADNTNNIAIADEVKGLKKMFNEFIGLFKPNDNKGDKTEVEKPPTSDGSGDVVYKELEKMKSEFQKQLEARQSEWEKKFEDLVKKQTDEQEEKASKKIRNEIVKAKEVGFIKTDDKKREEWLVNALKMDFEGTRELIKEYSNKDKPKPPMEAKLQQTLSNQIAKQSMNNFF